MIGELSALEAVDGCLARIEELARLNAFTQVFAEEARARARELDSRSERGPLHGVPVAVKDLMAIAGHPTTCGTELHRHAPPAAVSADAVAALEAAGAVVVGATNLHEWANGPTSSNPHFGPVRNPWDEERVPGGSSGGSAVAVALDLVDAALGTDTGGSVRIPAGFCGVTGLRPTIGLVSNRSVLPVSASLDTVGPMARRVEDVARVLTAIAGHDPDDWTSVDRPFDPSLLRVAADVTGLRIGVPRKFYSDDVDTEIADAVRSVADTLARAGARLVDIELEGAAEANQHAATIIYCDACALHANALDAEREKISAVVYERLIKGRERSGVDYANALRFRETWIMRLRDMFARVDVLLYPTSPHTAPPIEESVPLEDSTRHATRFTYGGALAGLPGLSLPCGFTRSGLPIGALLEGPWWREADLLRLGGAWQERTDWHLRLPRANAGSVAAPPRARGDLQRARSQTT